MTREEARQVEQQLRKRYATGSVEVTRVWGGIETAVSDAGESVFIRAADGSPLLVLLAAGPEQD